MSRPCYSIGEIVSEVLRILDDEKAKRPEADAEFFFRGERQNFAAKDNSELGTAFPCSLYQPNRKFAWKYERELYQEALRYNVVDFDHDRTMAERLARMQHYQLPTRFNDLTDNALQAAYFATGAGSFQNDVKQYLYGWVRVIKVAKRKMKSFTSDIIVAISHLPLVDSKDIHLSGPLAVENEDDAGLNVLRYEIMKERPAFGFEAERPKVALRLRHDIQQVWAFKPVLNTPRIKKQGGIFLAVGCGEGKRIIHPTYSETDYNDPDAPSSGIMQIGAIRIAADAKKKILEELRHFGVLGETVYPELSDVCQRIDERLIKEHREDH